ncbi:hypothetical protein [Legionella quinlivanii]|nr:hypothetical protein [Legionella quinlivanii]
MFGKVVINTQPDISYVAWLAHCDNQVFNPDSLIPNFAEDSPS